MQRNLIWNGLDADTVENCAVNYLAGTIIVRSQILGWQNMEAIKIEYVIRLDSTWRVLDFEINAQIGSRPTHYFAMHHHTDGKWYSKEGHEEKAYVNCNYIDISLTPFTNSLPINGLALTEGQSMDVDVLYIDIMKNDVRRDRQRYSKLGRLTYRFENDNGEFTADINVDEDGFVTDYPELFESI